MNTVGSDRKKAKTLSLLVATVLALLPFHAFFTTWVGSNTSSLDLVRIWKEVLLVLTVLLAGLLIYRLPKLRQWLVSSWISRLVGLYIALHLVLALWASLQSKVNAEALVYSLGVNLRFLVFFIVCVVAAATFPLLGRAWHKIILIPAALVISFGLAQKLLLPHDFLRHFGYGPDTIPAYQTIDKKLEYQRIQSTLRGANPLGAYMVIILSVLFSFVKKNANFVAIGLAAGGLVLFFSYSRSAWVGTALALGLLFWWAAKGKIKSHLLVTAVVAVLVFVAGFIYLLRDNDIAQDTFFHTSETSTSAQSSNEQRTQALSAAAEDVINEPLGRGPGTAGPASIRNDSHEPRIAENYYLQLAQEVGVIGSLIFITINVLVALQLWQKRRENLAKVLLASLVGITFINLVSHAWTDDTLAYLWWGLAGIALSPAILASRRKHNGQKSKNQSS